MNNSEQQRKGESFSCSQSWHEDLRALKLHKILSLSCLMAIFLFHSAFFCFLNSFIYRSKIVSRARFYFYLYFLPATIFFCAKDLRNEKFGKNPYFKKKKNEDSWNNRLCLTDISSPDRYWLSLTFLACSRSSNIYCLLFFSWSIFCVCFSWNSFLYSPRMSWTFFCASSYFSTICPTS